MTDQTDTLIAHRFVRGSIDDAVLIRNNLTRFSQRCIMTARKPYLLLRHQLTSRKLDLRLPRYSGALARAEPSRAPALGH